MKYNLKRDYKNYGVLEDIEYSSKNLKLCIMHLFNTPVPSDSVLFSIKNDLIQAFQSNILSPRQKYIIQENLIKNRPQREIAKELNVTQQNISATLNTALNRIQKYFVGNIRWIKWTDSEKQFLLENYGKISLQELSNKLNKNSSSVISMYHYIKRSRR